MHSLLTEFLFSKMYLVTLTSILGGAGDALVYHNGMEFSTNDKDNVKKENEHCAEQHQSAWWYKSCYLVVILTRLQYLMAMGFNGVSGKVMSTPGRNSR